MNDLTVGIAPEHIKLDGYIWFDEEYNIETLYIVENPLSQVYLQNIAPKMSIEFYSDDGPLGRYTFVTNRDEIFVFGRGDIPLGLFR